ncbi:DUF1835 domain-containing protein [Pectobacterium zantedeschiae]|uniref:DUF1835 domain-containing protein n=1 Tax=Pectobacterium zantedeschiae TaxID=2034769 RepID=A0A9X8P5Z6_9GAMM|nr:DUF1835 domain-containing protein [Pectobacterium zantedeschiae]RYC38336.1 hypothetical protein CTN06_18310 [Pectobacterium zantedeschiae]RYC44981.1 DUF1835 domain-containing protein [Pectobacterium zantedeschiae]
MSTKNKPQPESGKINLDHQRKLAKELLRHLRNGTASPESYSQLLAGNPRSKPTLTDAQWLIARELGFSSWMKLKAHVDAINFAARNPDCKTSDEVFTTHWRCGNDIAHTLRIAGFKGHFRTLTDPLCIGPVQNLHFDEFKNIRSLYISRTFGIQHSEVLHRLEEEYKSLLLLKGDNHNVLWCEGDAYDQLFLVRLLAGLDRLPTKLELIQVDGIPGVSRFIGIGQLAPELLAWLWLQRKPVNKEMIQLAGQAWSAFCSDSPVELANIAHSHHECLPFLAPALLRQLQELPAISGGLSLTERLALEIVNEKGTVSFRRVFNEITRVREPLPFLGDMMFHSLMRPLIDTVQPLLIELDVHKEWTERTLTITQLGREALTGLVYWPNYASHERWVGGVCIKPGHSHWMIDENNKPVWNNSVLKNKE